MIDIDGIKDVLAQANDDGLSEHDRVSMEQLIVTRYAPALTKEIERLQKSEKALLENNEQLTARVIALENQRIAAMEKLNRTCLWEAEQEPDLDTIWKTGCGNMFVFIEDGPEENECKFCPYCGGKSRVKYE